MYRQRTSGALQLAAVIVFLQACAPAEEAEDATALPPGEQSYEVSLSGSVGDGPVVDSTLTVISKDGQILSSTISDLTATYNVQVRTKGKHYPLTLEAKGGLDLVTRMPLDFTMHGVSAEPRAKSVVNVNPFSTLAVAVARQMDGGLSASNLASAIDAVVVEFNLGMTSAISRDPLSVPVDDVNLAEIVKASEGLAEAFRRTAATMRAGTFSASMQYVIDAIAADLTDGVLDGRGAPLTNRHVSAVTVVVSGQVAIELMRNELKVNGQVATPVLDDVVMQISDGQATELTGARPVTSYMIEQALRGIDAAIALGGPSSLDGVRSALLAIQPGATPATVRQALPGDAADTLSGAITQLGSGSAADIGTVLPGSTMTPINAAPVITGLPPDTIAQDVPYRFVPTAGDPDGDPLTFSLSNRPAWLAFDAATGELSGTPTAGDVGTYSGIRLSVSDGQTSASLPLFSITVVAAPPPPPPNTAPTISGTPPTTATQGAAYLFVPASSDADGDTLTFSIQNRPIWTSFSTTTGALFGTPTANDVGVHSNIVISVSDGQASASLSAFSIDVQAAVPPPGNSPPVISGSPATLVLQDAAYLFFPVAVDADGDTLTFSIAGQPSWTSFDSTTGALSGTPTAGDVGTYSNIVISVSDGQASASLPAFAITVQAVNTPPVISGSPSTSVLQDTAYRFTPSASDADGDALTYSIQNRPSWASFSTSTGTLSGTPTAGDVGTYSSIVISVSDGQVAVSLPAFSITVDAVALGSATLSWQAPTTNEDGSTLTDLAGYKIYWGQASGNYSNTVTVMNPGITTYVVDNLSNGTTHYFAVTALNASGLESTFSNEASKVIL